MMWLMPVESPSLRSFVRQNAIATSVAIIGVFAFICASAFLLFDASESYDEMRVSQWVINSYEPGEADKAAEPYDLTGQGVYIPPAREDREAVAQAQDAKKSPEGGGRNCHEQPEYLEASDLCAQWSSAAAMRFGNGIAAESFRINYIVGFISALGVLLAAIGVILAAVASSAASKGVAMMAYGFMPALGISIRRTNGDHVRITIKNAGIGPALGIEVFVDGERVASVAERLAAGAHDTLERTITSGECVIAVLCTNLAGETQSIERRFVRVGGDWQAASDQQAQDQQ